MGWGWGSWVSLLIIKQISLKLPRSHAISGFRSSLAFRLDFRIPVRLEMLPTLEPRGQSSGMLWLDGGGERLMRMDENNSRGEGSDPSPGEHSHPVPREQASVPSIHSPQLMPHTPTRGLPTPSHCLKGSDGGAAH